MDFCCRGKEPWLRARPGGDADELDREFASRSNIKATTDAHIHGYRGRFVSPDQLRGEWQHYRDGMAAGKPVFDLVRKK
jgi:hypothetical protein